MRTNLSMKFENSVLFDNWDIIVSQRNKYRKLKKKSNLKKRIKSKRKRKLWYKSNYNNI